MKKGIDYPGICVVFLCHNGKGSYLLAKRGQKCRDEQGCWDFGSGSLEFGESIESTLKREIREEYGVEPQDFEFLGFRDAHRIADGRPTHWIALDFKVKVDSSNVRNNEPDHIDEIGWFSIHQLPKPVHSTLPKILDNYREKL